jgi:plastocyanin
MQPRSPVLIALLVLALALAGCGSDDESSGESSSGSGGGQTLALAADPGGALKFDKTELTAKAGKVVIELDNPSSTPHAVEIEGNGVDAKSDEVTEGKVSVEADLKAGEYKFFCPVAGHEATMNGTLTVE